MAVKGFQDYWQVGVEAYFQQDAIAGVVQPTEAMGTIRSATPNFAIEKVTLEDSAGGIRRTVDEAVTKITESYDVVFASFHNSNLQKLFLADPAESFTQSATVKTVAHYGHFGRLLKIHDSDASNTPLFALSHVAGIYTGTVFTRVITAINATTKTITLGSSATIGDGDKIIVSPTGLANLANCGTYTVVGAVSGTSVVVAEDFAADETAITGSLIYADTGVVYPNGDQDADPLNWEVVSLDRGIIRLPNNTPFATGTVNVVFRTSPLSGERLLKPQTAQGVISGTMWLVLGRENNARQTVRECKVSIAPSGANFSPTEFADFTLTVTVLSEVTEDNAGRLLLIKGDLPNAS